MKCFAPLLLMSWTCLLTVACVNDPREVAALFPETRPDAEVITDFQTIYSDSAQLRVRISGPLMLRYREGSEQVQEFPAGTLVEFFDDYGHVSSTLSSQYTIRYENAERVVVRDSVVWLAESGDRLDSEELIWVASEERIYSDRFVRLKQGDKIITGIGFESNQDFTRSTVRAIQGIVEVSAQ